MRVSVDPLDPGHGPHVGDVRYVIIDGTPIPLTHVITADDEKGFAFFYVSDGNGKAIWDQGRNDFVKRVFEGKVDIVMRGQIH